MAFQVHYLSENSEIQAQIDLLIQFWENQEAFFEVQTSGSTGSPKTIRHKRRHIMASAQRSNDFFNLSADSKVLLAISPKHIGGIMLVFRALMGNYPVWIIDPTKILQLPENLLFDFVSFVPLQISKIEQDKPGLILQFKTILLGGSALSEKLCDFLINMNSKAYIGFGMTETISHIALRKIDNPVYTCLPGVSIASNSKQLILSDELLDIHDLKTNDEIEALNTNQFKWLGRSDYVINSGGIKLHPERMEYFIQPYISGDFVIIGLPDAHLGERCILVLNDGAQLNVELSEIQKLTSQEFGKYAKPVNLIRATFPYSSTGKILRKLLIQSLI